MCRPLKYPMSKRPPGRPKGARGQPSAADRRKAVRDALRWWERNPPPKV